MSILDFADNPNYRIVAVAMSKDDVVIISNAKSNEFDEAVVRAMIALQSENEGKKTPGVIPNNTPTTPNVLEVKRVAATTP